MKYLFTPIKIGTFWDIPLYLSQSTIVWILFMSGGTSLGEGLIGFLTTFTILSLLYLTIVIHEYGHALTAKYLGYKTNKITIYFIGGIAEIAGIWGDNPKHEFWITIMGPMTNLIMALIFTPLAVYFPSIGIFLPLLYINTIILAFNLIPAYPMDGGRLLRSALSSMRLEKIIKNWKNSTLERTILTHRIGMVVSVIAGIYLFYSGIYIGAILVVGLAWVAPLGEIEALKEIKRMKETSKRANLILKKEAEDRIQEAEDRIQAFIAERERK